MIKNVGFAFTATALLTLVTGCAVTMPHHGHHTRAAGTTAQTGSGRGPDPTQFKELKQVTRPVEERVSRAGSGNPLFADIPAPQLPSSTSV